MIIEREEGLMNCILDGRVVILDFANADGTHTKHYHRYKTEEKAEYMWNVFKRNATNSIIINEMQRKGNAI